MFFAQVGACLLRGPEDRPALNALMRTCRSAAANACLLQEELTLVLPAPAGAAPATAVLRRRPTLKTLALRVNAGEDPEGAIAWLSGFPWDAVGPRCAVTLTLTFGACSFSDITRVLAKAVTFPWRSVSIHCEEAHICPYAQAVVLDDLLEGRQVASVSLSWPAHMTMMGMNVWWGATEARKVAASPSMESMRFDLGTSATPAPITTLTIPGNGACPGARYLPDSCWAHVDHLVLDAVTPDDLGALSRATRMKALSFCYLPPGNEACLRFVELLRRLSGAVPEQQGASDCPQGGSLRVISVAAVDDARVLYLVRSLPRCAFVMYPPTAMAYYVGHLVKHLCPGTYVCIKPPLDAADPVESSRERSSLEQSLRLCESPSLQQVKNILRERYPTALLQWSAAIL